MKLKKLIIFIILFVTTIISANSQCFAKFVFEYDLIAAEIKINI